MEKDESYTEEERAELLTMLKVGFFHENPAIIELKTAVKWILAPLIAKKLDCSSNVNDDFNILMTFENEDDDQSLVEYHLSSSCHSKKSLMTI